MAERARIDQPRETRPSLWRRPSGLTNEAFGIIDKDIETLTPEASIGKITRTLATYNLVSVPIVDEDNHLLGAVTVDDVLDHILPEDWREERHEVTHD